MREKSVSAKVDVSDEHVVRLELPKVKVNTTTVEAVGSERMEKAAQAIMKKLGVVAKANRYEAVMIIAMMKMFAENVLDADQAEIDRTMIAIGLGAIDKPVN